MKEKKVFKVLGFIFIFLFTLFSIVDCRPKQSTEIHKSKVTDTFIDKQYVERVDTFIKIQGDTVTTTFTIDCDSITNKPRVDGVITSNGLRIRQGYKLNQLQPKGKSQPINLEVTCKIDSNLVAFTYYNTHHVIINKHSDSDSTKEVIKILPTKMQVIYMQLGKYTFWFSILILLVLFGYGFLKLAKYMKWFTFLV